MFKIFFNAKQKHSIFDYEITTFNIKIQQYS